MIKVLSSKKDQSVFGTLAAIATMISPTESKYPGASTTGSCHHRTSKGILSRGIQDTDIIWVYGYTLDRGFQQVYHSLLSDSTGKEVVLPGGKSYPGMFRKEEGFYLPNTGESLDLLRKLTVKELKKEFWKRS